jgi:hypothetical protein
VKILDEIRDPRVRKILVFIVYALVAFLLVGLLNSLGVLKVFGVEQMPSIAQAHKKNPCATVRPERSRRACEYDHGMYGHASSRQTYPRHFKRLALRAHTRYVRHHPGKAALSNAAWWSAFKSSDSCIAYYAARSKCPADGVTANKKWMNQTVRIVDTCGGFLLIAYFATASGGFTTRAALGTGSGCFWGVVTGFNIWD